MGVITLESKKHKELAEKIAKIKGSEYHSEKGIDIRTLNQAIEVEISRKAFAHAKQQLAGTTKTPYLAVPNPIVKEALKYLNGTRFGVMNDKGRVIKRGRGRAI